MKNIMRLVAVSCLLIPVSAHSEPSAPAAGKDGAVEIQLPALGIPKPTEKACRVVFPMAADDYITTSANTPVAFRPLDNDSDTPDQDLKSFDQPQHGTVVLSGGIDGMTYTPAPGYVGSDSFTYTIGGCLQCFNGGCTEPEFDQATVYITVN
ncbi:MAG TPA: Ig-like domain-containing protein [Thermoanaerobaculia bacterium]